MTEIHEHTHSAFFATQEKHLGTKQAVQFLEEEGSPVMFVKFKLILA